MDVTVRCPECAEEVRAEAKVCKHCGHRLDGKLAKGRGPTMVPGWVSAVVIALVLLFFLWAALAAA